MFKKHLKSLRLKWAKKMMSYVDKWLPVIFSDEKMWKFVKSDGYKIYYNSLRSNPRSFLVDGHVEKQ